MKTLTREQAEEQGYATFNAGQHFAIDVPDGSSTITCRTSAGDLITFAFMPYEKNCAPMCVDIANHGKQKNSSDTPVNDVICFTQGKCKEYRSRELKMDHKPTIVNVMLDSGIKHHDERW